MSSVYRRPRRNVFAAASVLTVLSLADAGFAQTIPNGRTAPLEPAHSGRQPLNVSRSTRPPIGGTDLRTCILHWNSVLLDANALDHTPRAADESRTFGEQYGPGRTARAFAIVHIAMFDTVNAVMGEYETYSDLPAWKGPVDLTVAVSQAAHDTLIAMYPAQTSRFDDLLAVSLADPPHGRPKTNGMTLGKQAAAAILSMRNEDGSQEPDPLMGSGFIPSDQPGLWRQDPISQIPVALGAHWDSVTPFVMTTGDQFRSPPPPSMESPEYAAAFGEVRRLGGDGITTPTERTDDQTVAAIFWGYDAASGIGTPPRLYNQITVHIANQMNTDATALLRLLTLVNVAMADASVAAWDTKYVYQLWRPVAGIREADEGTGPTGLGDGNPDTACDPNWTPLGAQASNTTDTNFTPPFPAYVSGHATLGAATFQIIRNFYGTDAIAFTFTSDEWNGVTRDNLGNVRPLIPRTFASLSQAEEENGQSRIYLGVHWPFDKTMGMLAGHGVADHLFENAFTPLERPRHSR